MGMAVREKPFLSMETIAKEEGTFSFLQNTITVIFIMGLDPTNLDTPLPLLVGGVPATPQKPPTDTSND